VYYSTNLEICNSALLIPGTALYPNGLLGAFYGITLVYLFLGIGIISDVFMSGIERITSTMQIV
jgi:solute carrier family 8 (sodium/calcium exchanger)